MLIVALAAMSCNGFSQSDFFALHQSSYCDICSFPMFQSSKTIAVLPPHHAKRPSTGSSIIIVVVIHCLNLWEKCERKWTGLIFHLL
jgi:hypothetical protein